ncbi:hypothetical protein AB0J72_40685 [Dactylosporangium sp. NPDC049742]|uniref:pentapeptide repeat-containing protein n=1 Tax=Dactylosporangium sp. NPDC049742 TaxID=3154737 RepID=UPI00342D6EB0
MDLLRVEHRHVELADVDFSGRSFDTFGAYGGTFLRCNFSETSFGKFSVGHQGQTRFVDCVFRRTRFPLGNTYLGDARFERCLFDGAQIRELDTECAEFVECVFRGRVWHTVFNGAPGGAAGSPVRARNEWRGNDFTDADLVDVDFRDIDLRAQRWPADGAEYALIDDVDARAAAAVDAIHTAPDGTWPEPALAVQAIEFARTGRPRDPNGFVLLRRQELGNRLPPEVREQLWTLLVSGYKNDKDDRLVAGYNDDQE